MASELFEEFLSDFPAPDTLAVAAVVCLDSIPRASLKKQRQHSIQQMASCGLLETVQ